MLACQVQQMRSYERYPYEDDPYPEYLDVLEDAPPAENSGNSLADYWKVFTETFRKSYEDLNKPYIVEKKVPVYIPGM